MILQIVVIFCVFVHEIGPCLKIPNPKIES
jgi:hypothetical protein